MSATAVVPEKVSISLELYTILKDMNWYACYCWKFIFEKYCARTGKPVILPEHITSVYEVGDGVRRYLHSVTWEDRTYYSSSSIDSPTVPDDLFQKIMRSVIDGELTKRS